MLGSSVPWLTAAATAGNACHHAPPPPLQRQMTPLGGPSATTVVPMAERVPSPQQLLPSPSRMGSSPRSSQAPSMAVTAAGVVVAAALGKEPPVTAVVAAALAQEAALAELRAEVGSLREDIRGVRAKLDKESRRSESSLSPDGLQGAVHWLCEELAQRNQETQMLRVELNRRSEGGGGVTARPHAPRRRHRSEGRGGVASRPQRVRRRHSGTSAVRTPTPMPLTQSVLSRSVSAPPDTAALASFRSCASSSHHTEGSLGSREGLCVAANDDLLTYSWKSNRANWDDTGAAVGGGSGCGGSGGGGVGFPRGGPHRARRPPELLVGAEKKSWQLLGGGGGLSGSGPGSLPTSRTSSRPSSPAALVVVAAEQARDELLPTSPRSKVPGASPSMGTPPQAACSSLHLLPSGPLRSGTSAASSVDDCPPAPLAGALPPPPRPPMGPVGPRGGCARGQHGLSGGSPRRTQITLLDQVELDVVDEVCLQLLLQHPSHHLVKEAAGIYRLGHQDGPRVACEFLGGRLFVRAPSHTGLMDAEVFLGCQRFFGLDGVLAGVREQGGAVSEEWTPLAELVLRTEVAAQLKEVAALRAENARLVNKLAAAGLGAGPIVHGRPAGKDQSPRTRKEGRQGGGGRRTPQPLPGQPAGWPILYHPAGEWSPGDGDWSPARPSTPPRRAGGTRRRAPPKRVVTEPLGR